jgi:hypothetical protein
MVSSLYAAMARRAAGFSALDASRRDRARSVTTTAASANPKAAKAAIPPAAGQEEAVKFRICFTPITGG